MLSIGEFALLNLAIRIDPCARPQPDTVAGSPQQVITQLRYLLTLGFTGFNFLPADSEMATPTIQQIGEEILPALRTTD